VSIAALRPHIPAQLQIDTFGGQAWLGGVPFRMFGVHSPGILSIFSQSAIACTRRVSKAAFAATFIIARGRYRWLKPRFRTTAWPTPRLK
jgi:uncharacterized protein YqjF (DUF2071 family)